MSNNNKVKTEKDYIKELVDLYPVMSEEEMGKVVDQVTTLITKYIRGGHRGVSFGGMSMIMDGKKIAFKITKTRSKKSSRDNIRRLLKLKERREKDGSAN